MVVVMKVSAAHVMGYFSQFTFKHNPRHVEWPHALTWSKGNCFWRKSYKKGKTGYWKTTVFDQVMTDICTHFIWPFLARHMSYCVSSLFWKYTTGLHKISIVIFAGILNMSKAISSRRWMQCCYSLNGIQNTCHR